MEDGQCSVCSKEGSKRCSRCKVVYYCGRVCQKKDWKIHKKVCSDVADTTFVKENVLPHQGLYDSPEMLEKIYSMKVTPPSLGQVCEIPKFHEEYKKAYPKDGTLYVKLRENWVLSKMQTKEMTHEELENESEIDERVFLKRWGPTAFTDELRLFLSSNPKPGDIFVNKPQISYGYYTGQEVYQSMRNSPVRPQKFEIGETYVAIGFVDLFPLVVGDFVNEHEDAPKKEPMVFYGYDRSVIVITRNMVLYQMMKDSMSLDSILQVWFSTGWSKKTLDDFQLSCNQVLKNLDSTINDNLAITVLLNHWIKTTIGMRSVQILWTQHIAQHLLHPIPNLRQEKDRLEYARYISTGQIFGNDKSDFVYGNLSMFSLPDSFEGFKRQEENFYAAIAMDPIEYNASLQLSLIKMVKEGVQQLIEHIRIGLVMCHFVTADFNPQNKEELNRVKELNAKQIDWSNVPDYLNHDDFFKMARECGGPSTEHSLHFMNWTYFVFGTCIIDFPNQAKVYKEIIRERNRDFSQAKASRPFLRQDEYIEYYLNASVQALGKRYMKNFIEYFFDGRNVDVSEAIFEDFNPFARNGIAFFMSFNFRK